MRALFYCGCVLSVSGTVPSADERLSQCHIEEINSNMIQIDEDKAGDIEPDLGFSVVKYTVAGELSARSTFKFLNKYMKMQPREDTPWGNEIACDGTDPFFIARNDLVLEGAGKCTVVTSSGKGVRLSEAHTEDADGVVAVALGDDPIMGCNFMINRAFSYESENYDTYKVASSSERQCCLTCQGDPDCIGANFVHGTRTESYIGFGVHMPESGVRSTGTSHLNVSAIERIVKAKLGKMDRFDAWMDYSLGLWTTDLDSYMHVFDSAGVRYLPAKWTTGRTQAYSVFIHVEDSQLILELITASPTKLQDREDLVILEPRLPESYLLDMISEDFSSDVLTEARVSRATTDLKALDDFYTKGMRIRTSFSYEGEDVGVRCYEWAVGTPQICYTKRPPTQTRGLFKVQDFQEMLRDAAMQWSDNALCVMNRWYDNHYSVTGEDMGDQSTFNYIIDYLDAHPEIPIACDPSAGLYYISDPSGWAVQTPSGIGSVLPMRCGGGPISPDASQNTTAEFVFCEKGECTDL